MILNPPLSLGPLLSLVCLAAVGQILPKSEENQTKSPATLQKHTCHSATLVLASFLIWGLKSYPDAQGCQFALDALPCIYGAFKVIFCPSSMPCRPKQPLARSTPLPEPYLVRFSYACKSFLPNNIQTRPPEKSWRFNQPQREPAKYIFGDVQHGNHNAQPCCLPPGVRVLPWTINLTPSLPAAYWGARLALANKP